MTRPSEGFTYTDIEGFVERGWCCVELLCALHLGEVLSSFFHVGPRKCFVLHWFGEVLCCAAGRRVTGRVRCTTGVDGLFVCMVHHGSRMRCNNRKQWRVVIIVNLHSSQDHSGSSLHRFTRRSWPKSIGRISYIVLPPPLPLSLCIPNQFSPKKTKRCSPTVT